MELLPFTALEIFLMKVAVVSAFAGVTLGSIVIWGHILVEFLRS